MAPVDGVCVGIGWTLFQGCARKLAARTAVGTRLPFLPPYSPALNPIEQLFAKLKAALRKAQERTRAFVARIGALIPTVAPAECANGLRNPGTLPCKLITL